MQCFYLHSRISFLWFHRPVKTEEHWFRDCISGYSRTMIGCVMTGLTYQTAYSFKYTTQIEKYSHNSKDSDLVLKRVKSSSKNVFGNPGKPYSVLVRTGQPWVHKYVEKNTKVNSKSNIVMWSHVILGHVNRSIKSRTKEMIMVLYSVLVRTCMACCVKLWIYQSGGSLRNKTCAKESNLKGESLQNHGI